ncbi:MAG: CRISPR-associated endonuclease Cas1 [Nitrospirae bacterium]|nr:CRISPR-associated endonuclease Cas1 [Nitrospirota bacterium]
MSICVAPLIVLELRFRTQLVINKLPHYHGAHWSALFRDTLRPFLPSSLSMAGAGIWVQTVNSGILHYEQGETIHVGLTLPARSMEAVAAMVADFNSLTTQGGHFQPGRTVALESVNCRITGEVWKPESSTCLSEELLMPEINRLSSLDRFSILFYSPLRMPRPKGWKTEGHHYCDEDFFFTGDNKLAGNNKGGSGSLPVAHFIQKLRIIEEVVTEDVTNREVNTEEIPAEEVANEEVTAEEVTVECDALKITGGALTWLDVSYGVDMAKTIGGVVGKITVMGPPTMEVARRLVVGQYTGAGKNAVFGFGFYAIPELDGVGKIAPLSRGTSLFSRAFSVESLRNTLDRLPNSSPGPDMLTVEDAKKAGDIYLKALGESLSNETYRQGASMKYRLPKDDGTYREIYVQNVTDRLVYKAAADHLAPAVDTLMSDSSYAYRRGFNRKGAAIALQEELKKEDTVGIKADISAFFDSVNIDTLGCILDGLFPAEPLIRLVMKSLKEAGQAGIKGLPQGNPLSPALSNLYLTAFDREMEREGFRLIRYGDDFAVFFRGGGQQSEGIEKVKASLARLGLQLKAEKTVEIKKGISLKFLGYLITSDDIVEAPKEKDGEDYEWAPVFKEEWLAGIPVYLSSICRGAYSNGPSLIVQLADDQKEEIPWSRIGRIVVVGRSPFSGGVVYRAIREEIPVTFIDIMGRSKGHVLSESYEMPEIVSLQSDYSKDEQYCLSFARVIISAKINNSYVILRRNSIDSKELKNLSRKAENAEDADTLRGYEGAAAKIYFGEFAKLAAPFEFNGRTYRPPDGPVNVMLSLGYTLLYNRLAAVVRDKGYNPRLGFFHKGRGTHAALASDLMEELRHIPERIVLSLIHRGEIRQQDFSTVQRKGVQLCRLGGDGFRKYIHRFEATMATKASYHGSEKMSYNAYLDEMAANLKRSLKMKIPYKALRID